MSQEVTLSPEQPHSSDSLPQKAQPSSWRKLKGLLIPESPAVSIISHDNPAPDQALAAIGFIKSAHFEFNRRKQQGEVPVFGRNIPDLGGKIPAIFTIDFTHRGHQVLIENVLNLLYSDRYLNDSVASRRRINYLLDYLAIAQ